MKRLLAAFCLVATVLPAQTPLRLSGSTTVKGALEPRLRNLEAAVGRPLELSGVGTSAGIVSLVSGTADVAMLSSPLEGVVALINQRQPGRIDPRQLQAAEIGHVSLEFIVNPHNPVRNLTSAQIVGILSGQIVNWREVGGKDARINLVTLGTGTALLPDQLMNGHALRNDVTSVPNATQIPVLVARDPEAIGMISSSHARGPTTIVQTDIHIVQSLYLVTRGEPRAETARLIAEARKQLAAPL